MAEKPQRAGVRVFMAVKTVGFSSRDRAGTVGAGESGTFSQAPSLSGGSLPLFVKLEGSSRCSSSLPKPQMCVGPLNCSCFTPTYSIYEASPNPTENQSQESGLLRPLVKVKMNCG